MGKTAARGDAAARAERKFEKKLDFYAKVKRTVTSLAAQKSITKKKKVRSRQKKLKAYDLSELSEFLPEFKASQQPKPAEFKLKSKNRKNLVLKEGNQFQAVINHPAFQADPLGAIHQHLQSTSRPWMKSQKEGKTKMEIEKEKRNLKPQPRHSQWRYSVHFNFTFFSASSSKDPRLPNFGVLVCVHSSS